MINLDEEKENENNRNQKIEKDTLDLLVSMGNEKNGEGFIDANKLAKIIKTDFEMTN